jgi:AcrR family transcriptional regulator
MLTPPRILRDQADSLTRRKDNFNARQRDRENRILLTAPHLFAKNTRSTINLTNMAAALAISTATLRQHFVDLDALLFEILYRHLMTLAKALGDIPHNSEDMPKARRAAWLAATRSQWGSFTENHLLFTRDRNTLPEDLREAIADSYRGLGERLAPGFGIEILALLDAEIADLSTIEIAVAAVNAAAAPQSPAPPAAKPPRRADPFLLKTEKRAKKPKARPPPNLH